MIDTLGYHTSPPVFLPDPVARHHPLNRQRLAWWLALPGLDGGNKWYDIVGQNHGTLIGMTSGTEGWRSTTRPGGQGHVIQTGAGYTRIATAVPASLQVGSAFSVAGWINSTSNTNYNYIIGASNFATDLYGFEFAIVTNGKPFFYVNGSATGSYLTSASALPLNTWQRIVAVADGTNQYIYVNGVQVATKAQTQNPAWGNAYPLFIGGEATGIAGAPNPGTISNAAMDDVSIWGRGLSPTDVKADYDLSRLGYPGVLNRFAPTLTGPTGIFFRRMLDSRVGSRSPRIGFGGL